MIPLSYGILWIRARAYPPISLHWEKYYHPLHWNSNTDDNGGSDQRKRSVTALRQAHSEYPRCTAPLSTSTGSQDRLLHLFLLLSTFLSLSHPSFISWDRRRAIVPSADRGKIKRKRLKDTFFLINSYKSERKK